jgi:CubicO group peptidase (beta-lactamase class C family)
LCPLGRQGQKRQEILQEGLFQRQADIRSRPGARADEAWSPIASTWVREAGTLGVYSNYGAALAGALLANVAGGDVADCAERRILRPLGMATATYREPYPDSIAAARGLPQPMSPEISQAVAARVDGFAMRRIERTLPFALAR